MQRHRTPPSASSTSCRFGAGFSANNADAATIMPGVQIPHCAAPCARKLSCNFAIVPSACSPSMLVTAAPSTCAIAVRQLQIGAPSRSTLQAPQSPALQPILVPGRPISMRKTSLRRVLAGSWLLAGLPFKVKQVMPPPVWQNSIAAHTASGV